MPDAFWLADLGRASVESLWLPLAAWTAVALTVEAVLRWTAPPASLSLPLRGTVLASLPVAVAVPAALRAVAPEAAQVVAAALPSVVWLPEVAVGSPAPALEAAGPPALEVALGVGVLAVVLASVVALVRLGCRVLEAGRLRHALEGGSGADQRAVDDARRVLEVERPIAAMRAPDGVAPFTVGWRRPVVALPALEAPALEVAALHEVAHVRRADYAWHAAQRAVAAAFAAHPLVWVLGRGLDLDRERAADAAVLEAGADRRTYADLLFSYATLPAPTLALGAVRGSSSLKSRIDAMKTPLSPSRSRRFSALGRLAGLVAVGLVMAGAALVSPPPAVAFDSVSAPEIDAIGISWAGGETQVSITLEDGSDLEVAEAVVAGLEDAAGRPTRVTVRYGGGEIVRTVRVSPSAFSDADSPVAEFGFEPRDGIETTGVTIRDGAVSLIVGVGRDMSLRRATEIADDAVASGEIGHTVVALYDDVTVERWARGVSPAGARPDTTDVLEVADVQPELIGGLEGIQNRLVYPELQARAGVEGQAIVQFIVGTDGRVQDPQVVRSAGNDGLDRAALEAVRLSRFTPARDGGEPVRVRFAVPVTFRLGDAPPRREPLPGVVSADDPDIFEVAEVQPELIGGLEALQERIVYPRLAREAGIEGQVVVQFIVNEQGRVQDAVVLRSPDEMLSRASLEAVNGLEFRPGRNGGVAVKTRFAVPVTFRLPAGDGVDRGEAAPSESEQGRRLPHSGTDLTLLENEELLRHMLRSTLGILDNEGAAGGTATIRYTILPNGSTTDVEVVENTADRALGSLAAGLAGMMRFKEDRRPPQRFEGATFRLDYRQL